MCFSATASFAVGTGLLALGAVTARRARRRAELPFALMPALFGIQQLLEGALWLALPDGSPLVAMLLTQAFSIFSQVLWPIYVPLAVLLLEPAPWRRTVLGAFAAAGAAVGLFLLYFMLRQPIVAQVSEGHIAYLFPHTRGLAATSLYLLGTCLGPLVSSHRMVRLFGLMASVSMLASYLLYAAWFISVWCFFAASLSAIVLLQFPRRKPAAT